MAENFHGTYRGKCLPVAPVAHLSSSPVTRGGKEDTREIVRKFFAWLVEQQLEDERADYEQACEVVIEQR